MLEAEEDIGVTGSNDLSEEPTSGYRSQSWYHWLQNLLMLSILATDNSPSRRRLGWAIRTACGFGSQGTVLV